MKDHLRTVLIFLLTVSLMMFFLRNAALGRVWEAMRSARADLLGLSLFITAGTYVVRIERWRYLLKPIGGASFDSVGRATTIGFAANALLPGRVGEVLRSYVLARRERVSGSSAFATVVLERLLDLFAIVMIVSGFVAVFGFPTEDPRLVGIMQAGAFATAAIGVVGVAVIVGLAADPERAEKGALWLARLAPGRLGHVVASTLPRFLLGLAVVRRPDLLLVSLVWSVALWVGIAWSMWASAVAFGIGVSFGGSMILMGLVALGVAVPTPAGVGGYHAAYQFGATALYGAGNDQAVGAALVTHMIAFGPVTLLGLLFMAQEGLRLGGVSQLATQGDDGSPS